MASGKGKRSNGCNMINWYVSGFPGFEKLINILIVLSGNMILEFLSSSVCNLPYFPAYKTHRPIRRILIFSVRNVWKNNGEYILILVM
jgi:hypothetical protein